MWVSPDMNQLLSDHRRAGSHGDQGRIPNDLPRADVPADLIGGSLLPAIGALSLLLQARRPVWVATSTAESPSPSPSCRASRWWQISWRARLHLAGARAIGVVALPVGGLTRSRRSCGSRCCRGTVLVACLTCSACPNWQG